MISKLIAVPCSRFADYFFAFPFPAETLKTKWFVLSTVRDSEWNPPPVRSRVPAEVKESSTTGGEVGGSNRSYSIGLEWLVLI